MRQAEVGEFEGVGREVIGSTRLWKWVEKSKRQTQNLAPRCQNRLLAL